MDKVEEVTFSLSDLYGNDVPVIDSVAFEDDSFYTVGISDSDRAVDYASLQLGNVVRTANFNGVFVVSIPKGDDFDTVKKDTASYIGTVYHAFDRDHPEVFWLSGTCKVRIITVKDSANGGKEAYFFLALADKDGFTMRSPDWTAPGAVADGIARRDEAVSRILSAVSGSAPEAQSRAINRILTEQNEYNTTPDLTTIGNEPHECLSALEGRTGKNGPVCDGYSRAFKVLCDRLEIPCVLENGYAKPTKDSAGSLHMWNAVQLSGNWYGTDITWNDPVVKSVTGAKSGHENEQFLLVGSTTEIRGLTFSGSHPVTNRAAQGGVAFDNGPTLSALAFDPSSAAEAPGKPDTGLPFTDVARGDWFIDPVSYVYERGLMTGASASTFQPNGNITRQQLWMVLARLGGERPGSMEAARQWARDSGVSDGSDPAGNLTRQQLVTSLYRYCGLKGYDLGRFASLSDFPDGGSVAGYALEAVAWAVGSGIVLGDNQGALSPNGTATRAQFATILQRFCELTGA